jgi:DnaJ homologue, subfamily C, member 28, conserved domain
MKIGSFPDSQSAIRILKSAIKPMLTGFNKIVEERIRVAQKRGQFKNLAGSGKPLALEDDSHIAEELRLAYKILKNADCLPPEVELKKEIERTEELLGGMGDTAEKYRTLKKLNYLIMKLNSLRKTSIDLEVPQQYSAKLVEHLETAKKR